VLGRRRFSPPWSSSAPHRRVHRRKIESLADVQRQLAKLYGRLLKGMLTAQEANAGANILRTLAQTMQAEDEETVRRLIEETEAKLKALDGNVGK